MATRVFADEELARLREFPEISREELFRFFTLTRADLAFVDPGRGRGPAERLGMAVALCALPWLGFVPDKVAAAPAAVVARLAEQLKVDATPERCAHLAALDASYSYLRQFTPAVLSAVQFAGGTAATELLIAVHMLRELNATGVRKVPEEAPIGFVPTKWRGYLEEARKTGSTTAYRHYWELCVLLCLRDGLRSGDVHVPESRRYADPAAYLLTPEAWEPQRAEFCRLVGKSPNPTRALAATMDELHEAVGELETVLAEGDGPVRLDEGGDLVISPLTAEYVPEEATALKAELTEMLPFAPIVSLLIELDKRTGYLDCFTHASGKQARSPELKRNLIAVLLAHSTNLGLTRMAEASGISYDILAWTSEWYVREETLRAANLALIDYHQRLPLTPIFGTGTLSSSDGQRFPTRGKSVTARALSRYFANEGLSSYTHVTDQHATYGIKVIVATRREAHYVLDEILGNATDLPIAEHATDTHGVTLVNFGLFDLLGLQLSPRIRDLGRITLYRPGPRAEIEARFPHAGPLLTRRLNLDLIAEHYDDLLRLAGSLKFGHATASLLVGKLSASGRQNALAAALKEYGALCRTIYAARYLSDPAYRRKIARQLNKGESIHALKRDLLYAHEGMIRARHLDTQTEQAWCLTLATNAVIAWTTEYYGLAVEQIRREGRRINDEVLAHISPAHSENINFFGAIEVDIDAELAALGPTGYRPLRVRDTLHAGLMSDALTSASVVLPGGAAVTASATEHPDLFWALRGGGGGNFGVTTSLTFATFPTNEVDVVNLNFPPQSFAQVLLGWQNWLRTADRSSWALADAATDALGSHCRILATCPTGSGSSVAGAITSAVGMQPTGTENHTFNYLDLVRYLAVGNLNPSPLGYVGGSDVLPTINAAAAQGIATAFNAFPRGAGRPLVIMHALDGALATVAPEASAFPWRRQSALIQWYVETSGSPSAATSWLNTAHQAVRPYSVGGYVNYLEANQPASRYFGANLSRLTATRQKYDPGRIMFSGLNF